MGAPISDDEGELDEAGWLEALAAAKARADEPAPEPEPEVEAAGEEAAPVAAAEPISVDVNLSSDEIELAPEAAAAPANLNSAEIEAEAEEEERTAEVEAASAEEISEVVARVAVAEEAPAEEAVAEQLPSEILELAEQLRAGRAILCTGPRLAEGRPGLRELIARLLASLPDEEAREAWPVLQIRPLAAAGFVRRRLGDRFAEELARAVAAGDTSAENAQLFGALPFRALVNVSFDDAAERAFGDGSARRFTTRDAEALRREAKPPFVVQALGDLGRPETLLFSSEDWHRALADGEFRAAAQELVRARSLVLVGFAAHDPELDLIASALFSGAHGEQPHFALLPDASAVEREEFQAAFNLRVLAASDAGELALALAVALAAAPVDAPPADDDADGWLALYTADPARADAAAQLDRLAAELRERGDYEALVELMLGRVAAAPDAEGRAELLITVARVFAHEVDDAERALSALLAAYKEAPRLAAWHELERLATAAAGWDDTLAELVPLAPSLPLEVRVPLLRRAERWADLARALDAEADAHPEQARALAIEAAEIFRDKLNDRASAMARFEKIAESAPGDLAILRALERLYEAESRHDAWLENLARQAEAASADEERATLYRRLALAWEESPTGAARAEEFWETLLAVEPTADDALRALERLYRAERKWPELVETLRRRAAQVLKPMQAELYAEIGALQETELRDAGAAAESYRRAEAAVPDHAESLAALTRLAEERSDWETAVELLERRARTAGATPIELALTFHAGELCMRGLADARGAEQRFTRALELDPAYVPAMMALVEIYRKNGEYLRASRLLVEAAAVTPNRLERTRLFVEAGELNAAVDNEPRAIELYQEALAVDPEHVEAAERVAELLARAARVAELVPVLEMLARKSLDPKTQVERLVKLGRAARAAGLDDKSVKAFARAAELDPANLEAQRAYAAHLVASSEWSKGLRALERIFQFHIDNLPPNEQAELFSEMGRCELQLGARISARELVQRALEIDPVHRPSLLLQLQLDESEPSALINARRALLLTASSDEQARLLIEIGDVYLNKLEDPDRALESWREALEIRPTDHKLLHKCLDLHVERSEWPRAIEILEKLIAVEETPAVRARYLHTAGLICRDELRKPEEAAAFLRAAIDDDAALERGWQALEQLHIDNEQWKELARFYRNSLKRLGPESPNDADGKNDERLRVWSALGDVCWQELGERESAVAAHEVALTFDRKSLDRRKRLADLYVQAGPKYFEKSIAAHQHVLRHEKSRVLSYRALKHLYIQTAQREKSLLCSCALEFLRKGEPDDARKVTEYKRRPFATARRPLVDEDWGKLLHPDEDRLIDQLLAIVGTTITAGQAQTHRALGLNRKEAIGADDARSFSKVLQYVCNIFDVALPEFYERPDQKEPVIYQNCIDGRTLAPVLLLGAPLVGDRRNEAEQVFELARRVVHLRPERLLRLSTPHPQAIAQILEAAIELGTGVPAGVESARVAEGLRRALPPVQLEQVAAIGRALQAASTQPDEAALAWLQATDLTGTRAGFALVGDVQLCARLLATDGAPAGTLPPTQRLLDLIWSSVSEELFAVRKQLGLMQPARPSSARPAAAGFSA